MKKIMLIILASFMFAACEQPAGDNAGIIQRTDDLSAKVLDLATEYQNNSYELSRELYSDTVQTRFNSTAIDGLSDLIDGWKQQHVVFSDIKMSNPYVHTNYFSNGGIWSNFWFTWSATSNATGNQLEIRAHFDYKWEDGKIVVSQGFFADEEFNKEMAAAMKTE
tara:strand:+ start:1261 stop:1755 length:495 start_codon:yes stop_codon:yes gene_type:complete